MTPDVVSTPSRITGAETDKLPMEAKRGGRKVSQSRGVRTWNVFAERLARYLVSIEIACIPQLLGRRIYILKHLRGYLTQARGRDLINIISFYLIATNSFTIYVKVPPVYPAYITRVFWTSAPI